MAGPVPILFGAALTVAVMLALGRLVLGAFRVPLRRGEEWWLALYPGAACLSTLVFALSAVRLARPWAFAVLAALSLAVAFARGALRLSAGPLPKYGRSWRILFWIVFAAFTYLYFFNAMAPEMSPDGSTYHLGVIARYLRAHGFVRITTNMYAHLSQGTELLYMFAFAFGKHSAAALVHFAFLASLPFTMLSYARRFGLPAAAGVSGALLFYACPIVGYDGATAYIDVAVAALLFAIFYLLQIWVEERRTGLLVLIGLLAGFAYGMKYTAFVAAPYAVILIAWKSWRKGQKILRPVVLVSACALAMMAPWLVRNWMWYGNPLSPFYNKWFPNPYVHAGFEKDYREQLENWNGVTNKADIPLEVCVRGEKLQGVLGPVFLLAGIALAALRFRQGRQLLLAAAVFLIPYPSNIGARFLIPFLPFVSLAMGMVVANWKAMAPLIVLAHALSAWPPYMTVWCGQYAMRLTRAPVKAALRIEPQDHYLMRESPGYAVARLIEEKVPPQAKVLVYTAPAEAYTSREILVSYQASFNNNLSDLVWAARTADWQPTRRLTFRFAAEALRRVRVVETARHPVDYWSISEFHVMGAKGELPREPQWRLEARPNAWEVQLAFDNNPMTRWRSWEPIRPGQYVKIDFGRPETVYSVVLDTTPDQWSARLHVEGQGETGAWHVLGGEPEASELPPPPAVRRLVTRELRWQGVEYLLIHDFDLIGPDLREHTAEWGVTVVGERGAARLYHVE